MKNMSVSLTMDAVRARRKHVTRRLGWWDLVAGERVMLCEKCMGRKAGEPLVRIVEVEIVSCRLEKLREMTDDRAYGLAECSAEGFGNHPELKNPEGFVPFFIASHRRHPQTKELTTPDTVVNRIEWRYLDQPCSGMPTSL